MKNISRPNTDIFILQMNTKIFKTIQYTVQYICQIFVMKANTVLCQWTHKAMPKGS